MLGVDGPSIHESIKQAKYFKTDEAVRDTMIKSDFDEKHQGYYFAFHSQSTVSGLNSGTGLFLVERKE